jgi:NADPH:quinone reductase-like Zn-dependent oxidoreductase
MYKTAALTACLASLAAALQVPTRRQFAVGFGTAALGVPPALAAGGKVVVVGGAGFVGTEISHLLATQGVKVVSVSRRSAAAQAQKVQYEQFVDFVSLDASKDDLSSVSVWKSNFGRRTRCCLRSCVCSMAWRFQAIDATEVHEGPRNISQIT